MPVISTFFGIVIRMFYREHGVLRIPADLERRFRRNVNGGSGGS